MIPNQIKISVCIPVYGVEEYIERCARSLFEQTMQEGIEFIFINDCTKDKSIEILEQVLREYPQRKDQVKIIHHEKNSGLVAARKTGLKHATGDYIIHCDSDDWVDLNMYETLYQMAVSKNADMVYCSCICEYPSGGRKIIATQSDSVEEYIQSSFETNLGNLCTKLYRRGIALDKTLNVPDHICMGEDVLRNAPMLAKCKVIGCCPEVFYHYFRANSQSITYSISKETLKQLIEMAGILEPLKFPNIQYFSLMIQYNVLFQALKTVGISGKTFKTIFPRRVYRDVLFLKQVPLWKRLLLGIANISYPISNIICLFLLKVRYK